MGLGSCLGSFCLGRLGSRSWGSLKMEVLHVESSVLGVLHRGCADRMWDPKLLNPASTWEDA